MSKYDPDSGIIDGPFEDCGCRSHHQHGARGMMGCPVCHPLPMDDEYERELDQLHGLDGWGN